MPDQPELGITSPNGPKPVSPFERQLILQPRTDRLFPIDLQTPTGNRDVTRIGLGARNATKIELVRPTYTDEDPFFIIRNPATPKKGKVIHATSLAIFIRGGRCTVKGIQKGGVDSQTTRSLQYNRYRGEAEETS
ncbi:hypothetical protein C4579_03480, partial [Candidatus Microgenomates bacterium]